MTARGIARPYRVIGGKRGGSGDPVTEEIVMSIPCQVGVTFRVLCDGVETPHEFHGESITVKVTLGSEETAELVVGE